MGKTSINSPDLCPMVGKETMVEEPPDNNLVPMKDSTSLGFLPEPDPSVGRAGNEPSPIELLEVSARMSNQKFSLLVG